MEYIWSFNYPNGRMSIVCDRFFPCGKGKMHKLLKTLDLNPDYWVKYEKGKELEAWMQESYLIAIDERILKDIANTATEALTKAKEMEEPINKQAAVVQNLKSEIKALPTGSEMKKTMKERLKDEKEKLANLKRIRGQHFYQYRFCKSSFEGRLKEKRMLEAGLAILREYLAAFES